MNLGYSFLDIEPHSIIYKETEKQINQLKEMNEPIDKFKKNFYKVDVPIENNPDIYAEHKKVCNNGMISMTNDGNKTIRCGCGYCFKMNGIINDGHSIFGNK
jgi:hypothetical protein